MAASAKKLKAGTEVRFYGLYDRSYRRYTLEEAGRWVRSSKGAPDVDGVTIELIEKRGTGVSGFIREIQRALQNENPPAATSAPRTVRKWSRPSLHDELGLFNAYRVRRPKSKAQPEG
jgi:hypothetical protein